MRRTPVAPNTGKRFVDLDQIDVIDRQPAAVQRALRREDGCGGFRSEVPTQQNPRSGRASRMVLRP
jgi:hypothetical protein